MRRPLEAGRVNGYRFPRLFLFIWLVYIVEPSGSGVCWSNLDSLEVSMSILLFNTRDELVRVDLMHVVYFEADDNYTSVCFSNGVKVVLLHSLTGMEQLINEKMKGKPQPFIRIGKRYIVNSSCILQINVLKRKLILTSFHTSQLFTLSISKEALKALKELYTTKQA